MLVESSNNLQFYVILGLNLIGNQRWDVSFHEFNFLILKEWVKVSTDYIHTKYE